MKMDNKQSDYRTVKDLVSTMEIGETIVVNYNSLTIFRNSLTVQKVGKSFVTKTTGLGENEIKVTRYE